MNTVVIVGATGLVGEAVARKIKLHYAETILKSYGSAEVNLLDPTTWTGKFDDADIVLIAAGIVTGSLSQLESVNSQGVYALAKYCNKLRVRKLVLISSGAVYGETDSHTYPGHPLEPKNDYAKSKLKGEKLVKEIFCGRLNILRLYFPYGPREGVERLIPKIKRRITEGTPIICRPDGGPYLSMMHVDDMAKVIVDDFIFSDANTCEVNLASDQILSVRELACKIAVGLDREVFFEETGVAKDMISLPYQFAWRPFVFY